MQQGLDSKTDVSENVSSLPGYSGHQHPPRFAHSRLSNDWAHRYGQAVDYRRLTFQNHETGYIAW
jgi:hypothetical protein